MGTTRSYEMRVTRLQARQRNYLTRWKAFSDRLRVSRDAVLQSPTLAGTIKTIHASCYQREVAIGRPDFGIPITPRTIEKQERHLEALEADLDNRRSFLHDWESRSDYLASGVEMAVGIRGIVAFEDDVRKGGLCEKSIEILGRKLLAAGHSIDDRPLIGPQPPFELRRSRLQTRQLAFIVKKREQNTFPSRAKMRQTPNTEYLVSFMDVYFKVTEMRQPLLSSDIREENIAEQELWLLTLRHGYYGYRQPKPSSGCYWTSNGAIWREHARNTVSYFFV
ncbi:hypothetical protein BJ508DRAFT_311348 [Ascobolus immersus RN42]|uniref:Uncharacterized protein n=1 Tax=Ascobolus immersus RN42 TaxID=1160509 RepID=A0A3N4HVX0_ASCIM|nr:hypothetical protein BJ508DRAFT_311348 [Ascobolus immersus RN42]